MTTETAAETTSPGRTPTAQRPGGRPRRKKGEGQWALGYREPLNPNEQSKKDDNPLNVRARIENIYAKHGFASIDPGDLRGRFRWYGALHAAATGHRWRQRLPLSSRGSLTMSTSCCASASTGGALTTEQLPGS